MMIIINGVQKKAGLEIQRQLNPYIRTFEQSAITGLYDITLEANYLYCTEELFGARFGTVIMSPLGGLLPDNIITIDNEDYTSITLSR